MTDVDRPEEIDELLGERVVVSMRHGGNTTGTVTRAYDQDDGTMYVVELDDAGDAHMTAHFLKPVDDVDVRDAEGDGE